MTFRPLAVLTAAGLLLAACGNGASRESLAETLEVLTDLDATQATCVADYVYDESGLTDEQIAGFAEADVEPPAEGETDEGTLQRWQDFQAYERSVDDALRTCL